MVYYVIRNINVRGVLRGICFLVWWVAKLSRQSAYAYNTHYSYTLPECITPLSKESLIRESLMQKSKSAHGVGVLRVGWGLPHTTIHSKNNTLKITTNNTTTQPSITTFPLNHLSYSHKTHNIYIEETRNPFI